MDLRYELNSRIKESTESHFGCAADRREWQSDSFLTPGATQIYIYNPQPIYPLDRNGLGPRLVGRLCA